MGKWTPPVPPTVGYERCVDHCETSEYVKTVTIKEIMPADNSDNLERITFNDLGYEVISQKGLHKVGSIVTFIPGESVLPYKLGELMNVTKYLDRGRVRTIRLRGNRSEGLICSIEMAAPFIGKIKKWESPAIGSGGGSGAPRGYNNRNLRNNEIPEVLHKFYKMPNLLNEPKTFKEGELIAVSEKIHGMNFRCGFLKRPPEKFFAKHYRKFLLWLTGDSDKYGDYQFYVGTHNFVIRDVPGRPNELFWDVFKKHLMHIIPKGYVFYGELYGPGIQKGFHYDLLEPSVKLFSAVSERTGDYLSTMNFQVICDAYGLPRVSHQLITFNDINQIRKLSEEISEYTMKHTREGVVVTAWHDGHKMAKLINVSYLSKDDDERTEYH